MSHVTNLEFTTARKNSLPQRKSLEIALDGIDFRCGLLLLVIHIRCFSVRNHIQWAYYSKSGSPFPKVCCWCAGPLTSADMKAREEKLQLVSTCLPRCSNDTCVQKGWQTRGKKRALPSQKISKRYKSLKLLHQKLSHLANEK